MPRNQLIGLVKLICQADGTEEQIDEYLSILEANVPDPNVSDLIFHNDQELTPEEIIDKALSYKAIQL